MEMRPAREEDAAAVAELYGSVEEVLLGRPSQIDSNEVLDWWNGLDLEPNTWLFEEDGRFVAAAFAQLHGGRGVSAGAVRPGAQGRGLGSRLLELAEARLVELGAERVHTWALAADTKAAELLPARGYREARRFWDMATELDEESLEPDPSVPIEPFREETARAYHAALEEAFADHWEHRAETFEEWWERQRRKPTHDPSLWFLVRAGEEIAAVVRNDPDVAGGGYVGALGVRRPWRGRGFGRALLLHSFGEFRRRGFSRASLGVDAANPTGATRLYESAGMRVELEHAIWEKSLR